MRLLGATVEPVEFGTTHAEGGDERGDPRLDHERRDDALRDRLVRRPGPVSRARARAAGGDRPRGARAAARGGGRAAGGGRRLRRRRLERDRHVRRLPRRRGRAPRRRRGGGRGVARRTGRTGVLHGSRSSILADEDGQIADAHSISAGLDYPGVGPEHAWLRDTGRAEYLPVHRRGGARRLRAPDAHARGSSPRSSPRTRSRSSTGSTRSTSPSASRAAATRTSPRRSPRSTAGASRSVTRARRSSIYLVCEPETPELAARRRRGRRGRDRARLPVLRPAGRRARDPARRRSARSRAGCAPRVPRLPRGDARARRRHAARADDVRGAARGLRLGALRGRRRARAARRASSSPTSRPASGRSSAASTSSPRPRPTSGSRLAASTTDGWLYLVTLTGTTGARAELSEALEGLVARTRPLADGVPLYAGLRHLDARAGRRGRSARRRRRRRLARRAGRRGGPGGAGEYVASLRAALDALG